MHTQYHVGLKRPVTKQFARLPCSQLLHATKPTRLHKANRGLFIPVELDPSHTTSGTLTPRKEPHFSASTRRPSCAWHAKAIAMFITDRFLEVFAVWHTGAGERLPDISDVLSWLTYLDSQCPECTQIEWPVDD